MAITVAFGTNWCSSSSRFAASSAGTKLTPVAFPPGCARLATRPASTGSLPVVNTIGIVAVAALASRESAPRRDHDRDLTANQIRRQRRQSIVLTLGPTKFDRDVLALDVAGLVQTVAKRGNVGRPRSRRLAGEKSDYWDRRFLCASGERHGEEATCNAANERSPVHH